MCRYGRPAKIAIIMRGLPGSGKTLIAKKLKDLEAEHGGENPRIHALDDYFMTVSAHTILISFYCESFLIKPGMSVNPKR